MKYLIGLIVILAAAFFFPQIVTSTGGPCQALESKIVDEIRGENAEIGALAGVLSGISNGETGRQLAADKYPNLPETLACAMGYYTFDRSDLHL